MDKLPRYAWESARKKAELSSCLRLHRSYQGFHVNLPLCADFPYKIRHISRISSVLGIRLRVAKASFSTWIFMKFLVPFKVTVHHLHPAGPCSQLRAHLMAWPPLKVFRHAMEFSIWERLLIAHSFLLPPSRGLSLAVQFSLLDTILALPCE